MYLVHSYTDMSSTYSHGGGYLVHVASAQLVEWLLEFLSPQCSLCFFFLDDHLGPNLSRTGPTILYTGWVGFHQN
jgi:hypothetical protein